MRCVHIYIASFADDSEYTSDLDVAWDSSQGGAARIVCGTISFPHHARNVERLLAPF